MDHSANANGWRVAKEISPDGPIIGHSHHDGKRVSTGLLPTCTDKPCVSVNALIGQKKAGAGSFFAAGPVTARLPETGPCGQWMRVCAGNRDAPSMLGNCCNRLGCVGIAVLRHPTPDTCPGRFHRHADALSMGGLHRS